MIAALCLFPCLGWNGFFFFPTQQFQTVLENEMWQNMELSFSDFVGRDTREASGCLFSLSLSLFLFA